MIRVEQTKEIAGTVTLPPSTNLFILSSAGALSLENKTTIEPFIKTPLIEEWIKAISNAAEVKTEENRCIITPLSDNDTGFISIPEEIPFRDLILFLFTARGWEVELKGELSSRRIDKWQAIASEYGCRLETKEMEGRKIFFTNEEPGFSIPEKPVRDDRLLPLIGTALGLKRDVEFEINYHFASPLKNLFGALGFEFKITNNRKKPQGVKNSLVRKLKSLSQKGSEKEKGISYTIEAKFSSTQKETALITLPGDEDLAALYIFSKCLTPKGQFLIVNAPSDTTLTPFISYIRAMGNKPSFQASDETTFGETGTVMIQKPVLKARKLKCTPIYMYREQLPAMAILSTFSEGKSIFRNIEDLRLEDSGIVEQILQCIEVIGGRYGRMEDGIIIENTSVRDGFDIKDNLPAILAASCAIAGLKCSGESNINSESIHRKWPDFQKTLKEIAVPRKRSAND